MLRLNWRLGVVAGVLALGFAGLVSSPAFSAPDDDINGTWKLSGSDGIGPYSGTATVEQKTGSKDVIARLSYKYANGKEGQAKFTGRRSGQWLTGKRQRIAGINGVLSNISAKPQNEWFLLSADGLKLTGTYASTHEYLRRDAKPGPAKATITGDAQVTLVPNAPATIKGALKVSVSLGKVKLDVQPAGAVKLGKTDELGVGDHDVSVEPALEGPCEVRALAGSAVVATAKIEVVKEKVYYVLFGYMGAEVNYLESDLTRTKNNVLSKLNGYTVIEDGSGYSQSSIEQKLDDNKSGAKKVVIDWCTTASDWAKYFGRGSTKGYTWSSHGYMEPFIGCTDAELKTFEARQWSCADGHPESTGSKHFIREWRALFDKNAYGKMDFALNHSCATSGLGEDYAGKAWDYTNAGTKERVMALFGSLPAESELTFIGHQSLGSRFSFQQNYDGSAYFGMWDVSWSQLQASIKP